LLGFAQELFTRFCSHICRAFASKHRQLIGTFGCCDDAPDSQRRCGGHFCSTRLRAASSSLIAFFSNQASAGRLFERSGERARNKTSSRRVSPSVVSGNRCEREHALQPCLTRNAVTRRTFLAAAALFIITMLPLETAQAREIACTRRNNLLLTKQTLDRKSIHFE
jgi:hypothetical protein